MLRIKRSLTRFVSLLLCLILIVNLVPELEQPVAAENGYDRGYNGGMAGDGKIYAHGLDVSAWQESGLNFQNFADAGYDFVILRCGTSYGKDKCFEEYYASAKAAGLDVGCYYYSYATTVAKAKAEAEEMVQWMGDKVFEYPVYFDYEDPCQKDISGSYAAQICYAFMDVLKANGYLVGMYSMSSWLKQSWVTTSGIRDTYEGWVAHLPSEEKNSGITSNLYMVYHSLYCNTYGMYQYSFDTYVNGAGPFDANVCYKDYPNIVKTFGFNGYGVQESWVERAAFDVMVYRDRNPDIAHMTDAELKTHWKEHGIKEGRAASTILDLGFYLNNNPDLKEAFGTNYEAVYNHFITSGYKEYRKSSALFDGSFYCKNNPEIADTYKENYLLHYVEFGMKEGRRASLTYDPDYYWFIRPDVEQTWPGDYTMAARHYAGHGINAQTVAYDCKAPVISDVKISDVSAQGYTVSCTVTDDWGITNVAFPTWTLLNDQDDLAADFMNTQVGTQIGNTYTFRVKAFDHNNEAGYYVTHIYATDKGGNQSHVILDLVEVKNAAGMLALSQDSHYHISSACVEGVQLGTTANMLRGQFINENLQIVSLGGSVITGTAKVGTGTKVNLLENGKIIDSVTVIILGDLDGNGRVDTTDYLRVKSAFLGQYTLSEYEMKAADVDQNGVIDSTDYVRIKGHFLGTFTINPL